MTFVGPRPVLQEEVEKYGVNKAEFLSIRPGLTGYWQVSGRSDVSFKKRLELEQYYSNNFSCKLDIVILFKTVKVVLGMKGAD